MGASPRGQHARFRAILAKLDVNSEAARAGLLTPLRTAIGAAETGRDANCWSAAGQGLAFTAFVFGSLVKVAVKNEFIGRNGRIDIVARILTSIEWRRSAERLVSRFLDFSSFPCHIGAIFIS